MLTLTTTLIAVGPNGQHVDSRTHREPLTESSLLRAGVALISQEPDKDGWIVMALRTSS